VQPRFRAPPKARAARPGFTLVELLVVVAILGVAVTVVAAALAGGIRAWDAARTFNTVELASLTGLRVLHRDLMNSLPFYAVNFAGTSAQMSFAALINDAPGTPETQRRIGSVVYGFDPRRGVLFRRQRAFPSSASPSERSEEIAGGLRDAGFLYAPAPEGDEEPEWHDTWTDTTNYPGAVRIKLAFAGEDGDVTMTRTVALPVPMP
jgi:prepilin-type N-terminal cleavage/methylation domain-containing protein